MRSGFLRAATLAISVALGSTTASSAHAADPDPDPWIATDKALHLGVSAGIAAGSYAVAAGVFDARGHALIAAGAVTLAVGAGKELFDLAGYGTPSWRDFAADAAGTLVGLALAWSLDLVVRGVDEETPLLRAPRQSMAPGASRLPLAPGLTFSF